MGLEAWLAKTRSLWLLAAVLIVLLSAWNILPLHRGLPTWLWRLLYTLVGFVSLYLVIASWKLRVHQSPVRAAARIAIGPPQRGPPQTDWTDTFK